MTTRERFASLFPLGVPPWLEPLVYALERKSELLEQTERRFAALIHDREIRIADERELRAFIDHKRAVADQWRRRALDAESDLERVRTYGSHEGASCSMLAARLVETEKENAWLRGELEILRGALD